MLNRNMAMGLVDLLFTLIVVLSIYIIFDIRDGQEPVNALASGEVLPFGILARPFDILDDFPDNKKNDLNFLLLKVHSKGIMAYQVIKGNIITSQHYRKSDDFFSWHHTLDKSIKANNNLLVYEAVSNDELIISLLRFSHSAGVSFNYVDMTKSTLN